MLQCHDVAMIMEFFRDRCLKTPEILNFIEIRSVEAELLHAEGQTDRQTDRQAGRQRDRQADTDRRGGQLCFQFSLGKNTQ